MPQVSHYHLILIYFSSDICAFFASTTVQENKTCKLTHRFCWPVQNLPENTTDELYHFPPTFFLIFLEGLKRKALCLFHKHQQLCGKLFIFLPKHIKATNQPAAAAFQTQNARPAGASHSAQAGITQAFSPRAVCEKGFFFLFSF